MFYLCALFYYERNHYGNVVLQQKYSTENNKFFGLKENYVPKYQAREIKRKSFPIPINLPFRPNQFVS